MSVAATPPAARSTPRAGWPSLRRRSAIAESWPNTGRLLPWSLAGILAMLWLVPFNRVTVPIGLPIDSVLDRFVIPGVAVLWAATVATGRRGVVSRHKPTLVDFALVLMLVVAAFSVINNLETLAAIGEFQIALKKVCLLAGYGVLFYLVTTVVRPSELSSWCNLIVVLAAIAAIGVIYEYRTGGNYFYEWTAKLLPSAVSVGVPPEDPAFGRELVVGPTDHPIELGVLLAMGIAFGLTGFMGARTKLSKVLHALAATLIMAACFSTIRKTGLVAPVTALVVLLIYRPRGMLKLLPLGLVMVFLIQGIAPGAISRVKAQFVGGGGFWQQKSVEGRTDDYGPVMPDVMNNLAFGRGHGSYDPARYRFLDNEYLARIIETGVVGLVVYLLLILAVLRVAHRASRSKDPVRSRVGVCVAAGAGVYLVSNLVLDALAFPHVPYMFVFLAGLAIVAATGDERAVATRIAAWRPNLPRTRPQVGQPEGART